MARRPTISDLARSSGVSVATVDRVLNGRLPVREETARRVYEAAQALGYHAAGVIRHRLQQELPRYDLGFILQRPNQSFFQLLARGIEDAVKTAPGFRGVADIEFLETQTPGEIAARLHKVGQRCKAIGMVAVDHPSVTAAVAELRERGIAVFALLSDFASGVREGYIGLDNNKAGRSAAWAIARTTRPGKVAILVGSHRFQGHDLRETGFRSYFREHAPEFEIIDTMISLEDRGIAHEATLELLKRSPELTGLYVAGGGMEGVIAALREEQMAGKLAMVCNEITPESRAGLAEDLVTMVIATPIERLARELITQMTRAIEQSPTGTPGQVFLPFDIFISENI